MPVQLINPEKLFKPEVYRQVAIGTGARQVHVAGQVAYDAQGQLVSLGDLTGQVAQAYRNVGTALAAAGAVGLALITSSVVKCRPSSASS